MGRNELHIVCSNHRCTIDLLRAFLNFGKNSRMAADEKDKKGRTPVAQFCKSAGSMDLITVDMIELLVYHSSQSSLLLPDVDGHTPLDYLRACRDEDMGKLF